MPGGRRMTPLFDLLRSARETSGVESRPAAREERVAPYPGAKPVVRVELKPGVRPLSMDDAAPESPAAGWYTTFLGGRRITLSMNLLLISAFAGVMMLIGAWMAGSSMARKESEREYEAFRRNLPPSEVGQNQAQDTPTNPKPENRPAAGPGGPKPGPAVPDYQPKAPAQDPRQVGFNYLRLGDTSQTDAEGLVKFLSDNGVEAFALKLDTGGSGAKNQPPLYRLYALPGYVGGEETSAAREALKQKVRGLAPLWRRDHRGGLDFSSAYIEKFK